MRILLQTRFAPSVGGIETLTHVLCREWQARGHEITVSTDVADEEGVAETFPFTLVRRAGMATLTRLWRSHEVVVMMNVSLKSYGPRFFTQTPLVLTHHGPYWTDRAGARDWREWLKVRISRCNRWNLSVSRFVDDAVGARSSIIVPNCYDETIFHTDGRAVPERDLVFVGRLVSDKGADLLLEAIVMLKDGKSKSITIIGDGPELASLERQAKDLHLEVRFTGALRAEQVAGELRRHRVMVVPSRWQEPFGIVALEGMACGCTVVASDGGGLPEAVGKAGLTYKSGNADDLARQIERALGDETLTDELRREAAAHLPRHTAKVMAQAYLDLIHEAVELRRKRR